MPAASGKWAADFSGLVLAWDKALLFSESQANVGGKGHRVRARRAGGMIKLHRQVSLNEIGLEKLVLVFELPALVDQRDKTETSRVDVEGHAATDAHAVREAVDDTRIDGEGDFAGVVADLGNHLKVEIEVALALEGHADGEADREIVGDARRISAAVCDPGDYESDVTADVVTILCVSRRSRAHDNENRGKNKVP